MGSTSDDYTWAPIGKFSNGTMTDVNSFNKSEPIYYTFNLPDSVVSEGGPPSDVTDPNVRVTYYYSMLMGRLYSYSDSGSKVILETSDSISNASTGIAVSLRFFQPL